MRLVASQLRIEGIGGAVWWTFLVAVYIPASIALAWPLARILGLLPGGERAAEARRGPATGDELAVPSPAG